ncbi:hypothetical protein DCM91_12065 [Chitinophaga costaii]|uniref:hypothetical protein n=1 Tax=Chitinophaga costaii TaxID=1335309 RepID=UPI000B7FDF2C|nr:hypothetical protein [Chitinophaga costaii]PUZ24621.1 hypothetical protein DCM91_12065 [Chitinophaga costaii]
MTYVIGIISRITPLQTVVNFAAGRQHLRYVSRKIILVSLPLVQNMPAPNNNGHRIIGEISYFAAARV